jgi:hypothetical protein
MKKIMVVFVLFILAASPAFAAGGIDAFLNNLNVQARADLGGFSAKVSAQFGVPLPRVQAAIKIAEHPADAFMIFQLGQMSHKPYEEVVKVYQKQKGQGWGVMAKSLGIKPGSREFHALKNGDMAFTGAPGGKGGGPDKDNGKGKGKGKKDKNK